MGQQSQNGSGKHTPILTYLLSALCILLTVAHHTSAKMPPDTFWYRLGHFGHLPATEIWGGQWPALFSTLFIHGDPSKGWWMTLLHLGFNLSVLIQAGRVLEATLNPVYYYLFFVVSAMVGSAAELAVSGSTGVGASGVVYAMFGLLWAGRRRSEEWAEVANPSAIKMVVGWAFLCLILPTVFPIRIANAAHFAGLSFGVVVGWTFLGRRLRVIGAVALVGFAVLVRLSLTWMPWSPYWTFWKGVQERRHFQYDSAINWFQRSGRLGTDPRLIESNVVWTTLLRDRPDIRGLYSAPEQPDHHFNLPQAP